MNVLREAFLPEQRRETTRMSQRVNVHVVSRSIFYYVRILCTKLRLRNADISAG